MDNATNKPKCEPCRAWRLGGWAGCPTCNHTVRRMFGTPDNSGAK